MQTPKKTNERILRAKCCYRSINGPTDPSLHDPGSLSINQNLILNYFKALLGMIDQIQLKMEPSEISSHW